MESLLLPLPTKRKDCIIYIIGTTAYFKSGTPVSTSISLTSTSSSLCSTVYSTLKQCIFLIRWRDRSSINPQSSGMVCQRSGWKPTLYGSWTEETALLQNLNNPSRRNNAFNMHPTSSVLVRLLSWMRSRASQNQEAPIWWTWKTYVVALDIIQVC